MLSTLRSLVRRRRTLTGGAAALYLILYLVSIQDITRGGRGFRFLTADWERMFERIGPLTFEPVVQLTVPGLTILLAPLDMVVGGAAAGLVALGVSASAAAASGELPISARLTQAATLLAASACLAPGMLIVLAVPVSSSFVPVLQVLVPASVLFLVAVLVVALRRGPLEA